MKEGGGIKKENEEEEGKFYTEKLQFFSEFTFNDADQNKLHSSSNLFHD